MRVSFGISITLLIGVALAFSVSPALRTAGAPVKRPEPFALYDDFNGATLNPDKWNGSETFATGTDIRRFQAAGRFRMYYAGYGNTSSNASSVSSNLSMNFFNAAAITEMRATVTVNTYGLVACPANAVATATRARLYGAFFNAATPIPDSDIDNVFAGVRVQRLVNSPDPPNTFQVQTLAFRCTDATCTGPTSLPNLSLGTVTLLTPATISVIWDQPNHQFIYQYGANSPVAQAYVWSDTAASSSPVYKRLQTQNVVPNCTSPPRPYAFINTRWDDVYVNQSAATAIGRRAPAPNTPSPAADR